MPAAAVGCLLNAPHCQHSGAAIRRHAWCCFLLCRGIAATLVVEGEGSPGGQLSPGGEQPPAAAAAPGPAAGRQPRGRAAAAAAAGAGGYAAGLADDDDWVTGTDSNPYKLVRKQTTRMGGCAASGSCCGGWLPIARLARPASTHCRSPLLTARCTPCFPPACPSPCRRSLWRRAPGDPAAAVPAGGGCQGGSAAHRPPHLHRSPSDG